jgi:putative transposase
MSNHYHLLVELIEANLSRAIHWLNVSYTVWFNRRHGRSGHLFQGRFKSVVVEPEGWGMEVSRYIHLNPVRVSRHGLGKGQLQRSRAVGVGEIDAEQVRQRIGELRRYPWSSYRCYIGAAKRPEWLRVEDVLKLAGKVGNPAERYRHQCEAAVRQGLAESLWDQVIGQTVLGSERFVTKLTASLARDNSAKRRLSTRPGIDEIIAAVEEVRGEKWEEFRDRYGDDGRDLVLHLGRTVSGMSIRKLSQRAEIEYASAASALRRFSERARTDRSIVKLIQRATDKCIMNRSDPNRHQ